MSMDGDAQKQHKKQNYDWLKGYQFVKGQSGNPGGRPKGAKSMKTFAKEYFERLPEEEKITFLKSLDEGLVWQMAEGKPQADITSGGEKLFPKPILGGITNEIHTDNSSEEDTSSEKEA